MTDKEIIDLFYSKIIPEVSKGKVDCYFAQNLAFDVVVNDHVISKCDCSDYEGIVIPVLNINNTDEFDRLLVEYVRKAASFYGKFNFLFLDDIKDDEELKEEYKIKYIICTLFANATYDDFLSPISFLKSRIEMLEQPLLQNGEIDFGALDSINASLIVREEKSPIKAESPYRLIGMLKFDDGYRLYLPEVYIGQTDENYQVYGIQKTTDADPIQERQYLKNIRKGMIAKINGAPEHYFLAVMIFLSICNDKEIKVSPFLVERWNAKRIAFIDKNRREQTKTMEDIESEQVRIQNNITDIFIRYFTKLEDVTEGLNIDYDPFEIDSNLHVRVEDEINSRSILFNEIFSIVKSFKIIEQNKEQHERRM